MANQKYPYHDGAAARKRPRTRRNERKTMCGAKLTIVLTKAAEDYTGSALFLKSHFLLIQELLIDRSFVHLNLPKIVREPETRSQSRCCSWCLAYEAEWFGVKGKIESREGEAKHRMAKAIKGGQATERGGVYSCQQLTRLIDHEGRYPGR